MTARDSQTIVLVGDVHGERERLECSLALLGGIRADLVLLTGDVGRDPPWHRAQRITHRGKHDASVAKVLSHVARRCACPVVFVPGNHDLRDPPPRAEAVNADGRLVQAAGLSIAGFGGAGPTRFDFAYEWTEEEAERRWQEDFSDDLRPDILLSHSPPADTTLDRTARGVCVGSQAVRRAIGRLRPRMFVCGHIHEAWGLETVAGVPCINAGGLGAPHAREIAWCVEWQAGPTRVRCLTSEPDGQLMERVWLDPLGGAQSAADRSK